MPAGEWWGESALPVLCSFRRMQRFLLCRFCTFPIVAAIKEQSDVGRVPFLNPALVGVRYRPGHRARRVSVPALEPIPPGLNPVMVGVKRRPGSVVEPGIGWSQV
jgi:hypothetical protein